MSPQQVYSTFIRAGASPSVANRFAYQIVPAESGGIPNNNTITSGLVNRAWDDIKPGKNYCVELKVKENMFVVAEDVHKILIINVSEDGKQLTVEALDNNQCGDGPWQFQGGERTFYR